MKWSWKVGRIAGIEIRLHATFLILLGWVLLNHFVRSRVWREAFGATLFIATIFGIVILHELGHALAARHFGVRTQDITLLPMGGVARLDRIPDRPREELMIALAGPLVNVGLAIILFLVIVAKSGAIGILAFELGSSRLISNLFWVNVSLAIFNLLPAFPMDGGRVLRALLATRIDYVRATQIAARIGQLAGWVFALVGLMGNPFLVFIGLFVWMGADAEAAMARAKQILADLPVTRVMLKKPVTLKRLDTLGLAAETMLAAGQHYLPVIDDNSVIGILTREDLELGLAEHGESGTAANAIRSPIQSCSPTESADAVFQRLTDQSCPAILVMEHGEAIGIVTPGAILDFIRFHSSALRFENKRRRKNPFGPAKKSWAEEHSFAMRS